MYNLLLTSDERSAIDWIGNRYDHGDDLKGLLTDCEMIADEVESEDIEWSGDYEIEFIVPEHVSWAINEIIDNGNLECFSIELVRKLLDFANSIV
jgi:hypothetical protein